ncbi:MAG: helix-turn-helix domain-containing protein [Candidatus Acidiferrum sp.]
MRFDSVKELKGEVFRRLTGVQRSTFEEMAGLLFAAKRAQKAVGGKPNTLCIEDQLLMMLEYWREYRTYFPIGQARGISESAAYRNIKWCENTAHKEQSLSLAGPQGRCGKRAGLRHRLDRCNRNAHRSAQKNKGAPIRARRSGTPSLLSKNRRAASFASPAIKDGATTSGR